MRSYASGDIRTLCQPYLFVYWSLVSAPNCTSEEELWLTSKSKHQRYFYMLMSYYVNVAEKQNLTSPWCIGPIPCSPSDEVKLCCASHPVPREGGLRVIFTVVWKVTVCVFIIVHITGSKAANRAHSMLKLPLLLCIGSHHSKDLHRSRNSSTLWFPVILKFCDSNIFITIKNKVIILKKLAPVSKDSSDWVIIIWLRVKHVLLWMLCHWAPIIF